MIFEESKTGDDEERKEEPKKKKHRSLSRGKNED
jgi:hypothetical protein